MLSESFLLRQTEIKTTLRTLLVVQWIGVCLPMQGTQGQTLMWGDSTGCRETKPLCRNYWAWVHESRNLHAAVLGLEPQVLSMCAQSQRTTATEATTWEAQAPQPERSLCFLQLEGLCIATRTQCNQTNMTKPSMRYHLHPLGRKK